MEFFATVPPTSLIIVVSSLSEAPSGHCCWWPDECLVISNSWLISWFTAVATVLLMHAMCCVVSFLWELVALRWTRREKQQQPQQHNRVSAPPALASNRNTLCEIKKSCWRNDPTINMSQTNAQSIGQWPRTQHTSNCWHPCWPCRTLWSTWNASVECCGVQSCCFFQTNFWKVWIVGRLQEDEEKLQIISCWPTPVLLFVFWVVSKPCDLFVSLSRWGLRSLLLPAGRRWQESLSGNRFQQIWPTWKQHRVQQNHAGEDHRRLAVQPGGFQLRRE